MLRKAGLALLALIPIFGVTRGADLRDLYNEMYPVNALKRDAFSLCHESDPNFIRAVQGDRESCFGRMPHNIAVAIGYFPNPIALAARNETDRAPAAARLFAEATALTRQMPVRLMPKPAASLTPVAVADAALRDAALPVDWVILTGVDRAGDRVPLATRSGALPALPIVPVASPLAPVGSPAGTCSIPT